MDNILNSVGVCGGVFAVGFLFLDPFQVLWMPKLISVYDRYLSRADKEGILQHLFPIFMSQFF